MGFFFSGFEVIFPVLFGLVFVTIIGLFFYAIIGALREKRRNDNSPRLTVEAKVVAKRTDVSHHMDGGDTHMHHTSTTYYATFEVESGDRIEFTLSGSDYGMLAEGDAGRLSFQGSRFLDFERS